jgi:hypothetical protein
VELPSSSRPQVEDSEELRTFEAEAAPEAAVESATVSYPIDDASDKVHEDISDFPSEASVASVPATTIASEPSAVAETLEWEVPEAEVPLPSEPILHGDIGEHGRQAMGPEHFDLGEPEITPSDQLEVKGYDEIESAPAMVLAPDPPESPPLFQPNQSQFRRDPAMPVEEDLSQLGQSDAEASRSPMWPVAAALVAGLIIGFGGGYVFRGRPAPLPSAVGGLAPAAPASSAQGNQPNTQEASGIRVDDSRANNVRPGTDGPVDDSSTRASQEKARDAKQGDAGSGPGRLLVRSSPAGAQVVVDQKERGVTPATIRDLTPGAHQVRIARDGYVPEDRRVVITAARPSQSLTVDLQRTPIGFPGARRTTSGTSATNGTFSGALSIESRPAGAQVLLDGKPVGTTPMSIAQVDAGEHVVRLELEGYRFWSASVRVTAGERNRVTASLER